MPLLPYLVFSYGFRNVYFTTYDYIAIPISIECIATIAILLAIYIVYLYTDHPHIIYVIHSIHIQLCMIFLLTVTNELFYLLSPSIRETFLISSVECPWGCWELHKQYNLCVLDTLGPFISLVIIRVSWLGLRWLCRHNFRHNRHTKALSIMPA